MVAFFLGLNSSGCGGQIYLEIIRITCSHSATTFLMSQAVFLLFTASIPSTVHFLPLFLLALDSFTINSA